MKISTKLISAASALLVTGAGLAVVAPASLAALTARSTTYSGTATISLNKSLKAIAHRVVVVSPAKKTGSTLTFPVVGVEGNGILLGGGIKAGSDPVITTNDNGTGTVSLTVGGTSVEVFTIKNWAVHHKSKKGKVTTQRWHGDLYLTTNKVVIDRMNADAGKILFKAGQAMGKIGATVKATRA